MTWENFPFSFLTQANPSNEVLHALSVVAIHSLRDVLHIVGTRLIVREKGVHKGVLNELERGLIDLEYIFKSSRGENSWVLMQLPEGSSGNFITQGILN